MSEALGGSDVSGESEDKLLVRTWCCWSGGGGGCPPLICDSMCCCCWRDCSCCCWCCCSCWWDGGEQLSREIVDDGLVCPWCEVLLFFCGFWLLDLASPFVGPSWLGDDVFCDACWRHFARRFLNQTWKRIKSWKSVSKFNNTKWTTKLRFASHWQCFPHDTSMKR